MEIPTLIALLLLSYPILQLASTQEPSTGQQAAEDPATGGGNQEQQPSPPQQQEEVEVEDPAGTQTAVDCPTACDEKCMQLPLSCEFVGDWIPVLCKGKQEECIEGCDQFCACQAECGCSSPEGCDDDCSKSCSGGADDIEAELAATTLEEEKNVNNGKLQVVYKAVSEEDSSSDEDNK